MLPAGRQAPQELDGTLEAPTCPSVHLGPELRGASVPRHRPCPRRRAAPPPRSNEDFQAEGPGRILEALVTLGEGPVVPGHGAGPARPTENGQGRGCSTLPGAPLSLLCPHPPKDAATAPAIARRTQVHRGGVPQRRQGRVEQGSPERTPGGRAGSAGRTLPRAVPPGPTPGHPGAGARRAWGQRPGLCSGSACSRGAEPSRSRLYRPPSWDTMGTSWAGPPLTGVQPMPWADDCGQPCHPNGQGTDTQGTDGTGGSRSSVNISSPGAGGTWGSPPPRAPSSKAVASGGA